MLSQFSGETDPHLHLGAAIYGPHKLPSATETGTRSKLGYSETSFRVFDSRAGRIHIQAEDSYFLPEK